MNRIYAVEFEQQKQGAVSNRRSNMRTPTCVTVCERSAVISRSESGFFRWFTPAKKNHLSSAKFLIHFLFLFFNLSFLKKYFKFSICWFCNVFHCFFSSSVLILINNHHHPVRTVTFTLIFTALLNHNNSHRVLNPSFQRQPKTTPQINHLYFVSIFSLS